jgi:hypothetical protein
MPTTTNANPLDKRSLLIVFALALAAAALVGFYQPRHPYFFEISVVSDHTETAKLYCDMGAGIQKKDASVPYRHRVGSTTYRFPLPTGTCKSLRFMPRTSAGYAHMANAMISDRRGKLVAVIGLGQFAPSGDIALFAVTNNVIAIGIMPEVRAPYLTVTFAEPLHLERPAWDPVQDVADILPLFLIVLLGGLTARLYPWHRPAPSPVGTAALDETARTTPLLIRLAILAGATAILFLRLPDRFLNPQFWAEDGFFFTEALRNGVASILLPYGGYLLLVPRLCELAATTIPLEYAPAFLNGAALCIALAILSRVLSPRNPLPGKPLLALVTVLVPHPEDIFLTIENIQWILALGLVLLLISDDARTFRQHAGDIALGIFAGLTGVFSLIFLPFFAWRAFRRWTVASLVLLIVMATVAAIQLWFVADFPTLRPEMKGSFNPWLVPEIVGYQLFFRLFGGEWMPLLAPVPLMIAGGLVVLVLLYSTLSCDGEKRARSLRLTLLAVLFLILAASLYRFKNILFVFTTTIHISRYFFVPQTLFVWLLIAGQASPLLRRRALGCMLLFAYLATSLAFFQAEPLWDYDWAGSVRKIKAGENVAVPINPPGWGFQYIGRPK